MFRLLLLVAALTACLADEEPQASAAPEPILANEHYHRVEAHRLKEGLARLRGDLHRVVHEHREKQRAHHHHDKHHHEHREKHQDPRWFEHRHGHYEHEEPEGPVILRSLRPHDHGHHTPDIARQNKIIADVYSPDYAEPTWVLDYRYLKTGGRDYTRGPGGQIIILPKGIRTNEHKEFENYDALIEHLRLKNLADRKKPQYFMPLGETAQEENKQEEKDDDDEDMWKHIRDD